MRYSKSAMEAMHHQVEEVDPLSEEARDAVRRLCCTNARGATLPEQLADAEDLMRHLGVHPSQDPADVFLTDVKNLVNPSTAGYNS